MSLVSREYEPVADAVRIRWRLAPPVADVWGHLTDVTRLSEWLGEPLEIGSSVGSLARVDHGEGYVCRSVLEGLDPAHRLVEATWGFPDEHETWVRMLVEPAPDSEAAASASRAEASELVLEHRGLGQMRDSYANGWVTHLTYFEASLNGAPLPAAEFWNLHATVVALAEESRLPRVVDGRD